jgi:hypothetical protein
MVNRSLSGSKHIMHDELIESEKRAQRIADRQAYYRLSPRQKKIALEFAAFAYTNRETFRAVLGGAIGAVGLFIHYFFYMPYQGAAWLADKSVTFGGGLAVGAATGIARGALALGRGILLAAYAGTKFLGIDSDRKSLWLEKIQGAYRRLYGYRNDVIAWGRDVRARMSAAWNRGKTHLKAWRKSAGEIFEVYGAIALYRGTKGLLNPRRADGRPFLGTEGRNKAFGLVMAAATFGTFIGAFAVVGAMAKIWHFEIGASALTDTSHWAVIGAKQLLYHPAITLGLTASKFVLMPVIAASRQALKSYDFTAATAHLYNRALRQKELRTAPEAVPEKNPGQQRPMATMSDASAISSFAAADITGLSDLSAASAMMLATKSPTGACAPVAPSGETSRVFNNSAKKMFKALGYLVEKSSPAYYEGRAAHYAHAKARQNAHI